MKIITATKQPNGAAINFNMNGGPYSSGGYYEINKFLIINNKLKAQRNMK